VGRLNVVALDPSGSTQGQVSVVKLDCYASLPELQLLEMAHRLRLRLVPHATKPAVHCNFRVVVEAKLDRLVFAVAPEPSAKAGPSPLTLGRKQCLIVTAERSAFSLVTALAAGTHSFLEDQAVIRVGQ
jgi:hypothetical protein